MAIFLSYRRGSAEHAVGRIFDRIRERFPDEEVFYDIDNIPLGVDFVDYLTSWVEKSDLFVVVIGPDWDAGRLNQEDDFVRIEVEAALAKGIPVIPVLVNGVETVPAPETLPEVLRPLSLRQGLRVGSGVDFPGQIENLLRGLETHMATAQGANGDKAPVHAVESKPTAPPSADAPIAAAASVESGYEALLRSAVLERNVLWTLGTVTLGAYYFFAGSFLFRRVQALLLADDSTRTPPPFGRGHHWLGVVGLTLVLLAWSTGLFYLWLVVYKAEPLYERYISPAFIVTAGLFWVSTGIGLGWLWFGARTLGDLRQALAQSGRPIPRPWTTGEGGLGFDPTSQLLRKIMMFALFFPIFMYVVSGLQSSLVEGVGNGTISIESLYLRVVLIVVIPFFVLLAGTQLCGELVTEFLEPRSVPVARWQRMKSASWFWPAMLLNLVAGGWGYYLVNRFMLSAIFEP